MINGETLTLQEWQSLGWEKKERTYTFDDLIDQFDGKGIIPELIEEIRKLRSTIVKAEKPAAGPWRTDLENAPVHTHLALLMDDQTWISGGKLSDGAFTNGLNEVKPVAFAEINIEDPQKQMQAEQAQSETYSPPLLWAAILELDQRVKALEGTVKNQGDFLLWLQWEPQDPACKPQPVPTDEAEIPQTASTIGLSRDFPKSTDDELGKIKQIIRDYHYALDTRQHGEVAMGRAMDAIMGLLCMPWESGAELNRRVVRGQE